MFYESPVFPDYLAYGLVVGPAFNTTVVRVQSGAESRNQLWEYDLRAFDGTTTHRTQVERNEITAFFLAMRGRLHGFRIRDVSDYQVAEGEGAFEQIDDTHFQLHKYYSLQTLAYTRPIYKPRGVIEVDGAGSYTVDYATGIVTATGAVPSSWTGLFDVPARFDQDELPWEVAERGAGGLLYIATSMRIIETREF